MGFEPTTSRLKAYCSTVELCPLSEIHYNNLVTLYRELNLTEESNILVDLWGLYKKFSKSDINHMFFEVMQFIVPMRKSNHWRLRVFVRKILLQVIIIWTLLILFLKNEVRIVLILKDHGWWYLIKDNKYSKL